MKKTQSTIYGFFKRNYVVSSSQDAEETINLNDNIPPRNIPVIENPCKKAQMNSNDIDLSILERDPGLRHQVYDYPVNQQDTIRRAYMNLGPLQPSLSIFLKSVPKTHKPSFQASWVSKLEESGGKKYVLLMHMGTECTSFHNIPQKGCDNLLNEVQDIRNFAFRALGEFSTELKELFCRAPKSVGGRFCLLVDEALDQSHKEQMYVVLRFVNKDGLIIEHFLGLVHVRDTKAQTLKDGIYSLLSHYNLDVKSIRVQGYDGAGNMQGQFKGLQALILRDCKYAYYVHCLAHRLQLALMSASQGVITLRKFFSQLSFVVNIVNASSKRTDQLRDAQVEQIAYLISIDELETGSGLNQIGTLQRAGDTRWSSHLRSVSSLIKMFSPTCEVLLKSIEEGTSSIRGDADSAYEL
ncbi:hypothetical protein OROMI_029945 [Orobanche minor]